MAKSAFIALDIQNGAVGFLSNTMNADAYLEAFSETMKAARRASIPVIFVTGSFRDGYPDISSHNFTAARIDKSSGHWTESSPSVGIPAGIELEVSDIRIVKRRVSAFHATDLDLVLRAQGVESIVVAGLATSGAVLSTVRQGADLDYSITVLEDLCADRDKDVHTVLMEKVFPRQGRVMSSSDWVADTRAEEQPHS
ncbi:isochorismatase family protein [Colletotrichum eremochloae]|nr:isochorismatase family protein [Colletotrichum eremochloae]